MNELHLRLPATSANLGPGFDTLALALNLYLDLKVLEADSFSIAATGRNSNVCGALAPNLLLDVYRETLAANERDVRPLALEIHNEIPVGMGCGSSAAARLAGVALAAHFGRLAWTRQEVLAEAVRLEGHPDNAAACWMGGFVAGCWDGTKVLAVSIAPPSAWHALIVLPEKPLPTAASRATLPERYSRADVVSNLQRVAVLTAAFASGRPELIAESMRDWMHQPYRSGVCPLLPRLLQLSGTDRVLGVALSGAGPAVLVLVDSAASVQDVEKRIRANLGESEPVEILRCEVESQCATVQVTKKSL